MDDVSILAAIEQRAGFAAAQSARMVVQWIKAKADRVRYNSNPQWGTIAPLFVRADEEVYPFTLGTKADLIICFEFLAGKQIFGDVEMRKQLLSSLAVIPGFALSEIHLQKRPTIKIAELGADAVERFLGVMDWFAETYRRSLRGIDLP